MFHGLERIFHALERIFQPMECTFRAVERKTIIMDALYDFLPVPSANAEDTTPRLYPKIVSKGTVTFEKLTEQIANHSKTTVWHDLNKWTEAHLIGIEGRAPHRVYVKSAFNPVAM